MRKVMLIFFVLLWSCSLYAANHTIRFATEATYPPFEYIDASGKIQGFDIDIANALCSQMKATCSFVNQSFNSLIPSLQLGKFDALIAALGVTPEREKQVSFTASYYEPSASFVALLDKHYTLSSLIGKTIGVQQGSTFEKYLLDQYRSKITMKAYASIQDAFLDLISGRVDIVIADTPIAYDWLKQNDHSKKFGVIDKPIIDKNYFGSGYGIAVRKDNVTLLNSLNQALQKIKTNGTYQSIKNKYFGA